MIRQNWRNVNNSCQVHWLPAESWNKRTSKLYQRTSEFAPVGAHISWTLYHATCFLVLQKSSITLRFHIITRHEIKFRRFQYTFWQKEGMLNMSVRGSQWTKSDVCLKSASYLSSHVRHWLCAVKVKTKRWTVWQTINLRRHYEKETRGHKPGFCV